MRQCISHKLHCCSSFLNEQMRKASKPPSEWLRLLCRQWADENEVLVETADAKFIDFKPYLKGLLSSQLLCRLSIPSMKDPLDGGSVQPFDFWEILGIEDSFDRAYIVSQVERFCAIYSIRALTIDDDSLPLFAGDLSGADPTALAAAAAAGIVSPSGGLAYLDSNATAAAAAAILPADSKGLRQDSKQKEQKRLSLEKKEQKARDREAMALRKANERAAREASREERRRKKIEIRQQREKFASEQKEAALRRAAELVCSNRVPIEITRGAAAAKAVTLPVPTVAPPEEDSQKKNRSAIVVSTAADLDQIVTHSKNLWAKYNAIAKEHNQKVNWTTVAKELGIHVKVREKYARMHFRAEQRGFDWVKYGDWKIKDHPEIFLEPTQAEQKAKMPPPPPDPSSTVLISDNNQEIALTNGERRMKDEHDDAVATAAAVVDATVTSPVPEDQTAAAVAATFVADPTAGYASDNSGIKHNAVSI